MIKVKRVRAKAKVQAKVAANIRKILAQKGMSAERLAHETSMSKCYLYDFLNGHKDALLITLEKIADGLDVRVEDFFKD
jgi:transcriptional regulator with XRE-family HTH domain